jgi:integrase
MGEVRRRGHVWWIRYYRDGKRYEESSKSTKKTTAQNLLKLREGDVAKGIPVTAKIGQFRIDEALADVVTDYRVNGKRSARVVQRRIAKHLLPYFGGRRAASITTSDVRNYIAHRQAQTTITRSKYTLKRADGSIVTVPASSRTVAAVSAGEINRELTTLKRAFSLAIQGAKLLTKPYIPMLKEPPARSGFFERAEFEAVMFRLPAELKPLVTFAYITGWRLASEVQSLRWSQVDFSAGEVRLNAGTTKNDDGRVFPMTKALRLLLEERWRERQRIASEQERIVPWVFFRMVARGRRGQLYPKPITTFTTAWKNACKAAGCPGRIPHDFRRTAVRNLVRAHVPERVAMQMTGHKTRSVFERYNIVSAGDLKDAARRLDEVAGTEKGQSADQPASETSQPSTATASQSVA